MEPVVEQSETLTNLILKINELSDSLCERAESIRSYIMGGRNTDLRIPDNKPECLGVREKKDDIDMFIAEALSISFKLDHVDVLLRQIQDDIHRIWIIYPKGDNLWRK